MWVEASEDSLSLFEGLITGMCEFAKICLT